MTDKGHHFTWQKEEKEAENSNVNAILSELRSHRDEFKTLKSECFPQTTMHIKKGSWRIWGSWCIEQTVSKIYVIKVKDICGRDTSTTI